MSVANFSHTPFSIPSLLLVASVARKYFTVSSLPVPICLCSSWVIWCLSLVVNVGALSIAGSFASFLKISESAAKDLEVLSKVEVLAAAIYYIANKSQWVVSNMNSGRMWNVREHSRKFHPSQIKGQEALNPVKKPLGHKSAGVKM